MKKKLLIGGGVLLLLVILNIINYSVYPFRSLRPNYHDVEAVFDRLKIPSDWVKVSSSKNKGIAGRACPPEGSGCFHKSATYKIPAGVDSQSVAAVIKTMGCVSVSVTSYDVIGGNPHSNFLCSTGGVNVGASLESKSNSEEITIGVST